MSNLTDRDGVDGPFNRAIGRAIRDDERALRVASGQCPNGCGMLRDIRRGVRQCATCDFIQTRGEVLD